ncbi:MAG: Putative diheme cytochrome c-553, partial [uncultured Microvirga sp.]
MRRIGIVALSLLVLGAGGFWLLTSPSLSRAGLEPIPAGAPDLANGERVYYAGGCSSCHATPEQNDKTLLGGGYPLRSPYGTFYVPNLSPHPRDGIGSWTPEQFLRAMRGGVSPDGRHYYPSFPYTSYQ